MTRPVGLSPAGAALRRFRRANGLSQETVADALGVHQSMVSKWETGREGPSFGNERAIWNFIGEKPLSEQVDGLIEAVSSMTLSAGLFGRDGRPIAESRLRRGWTGGAPLADLVRAPDRAKLAAYGGLDAALAHPDLIVAYHRRRPYTGEHTFCALQNLTVGRVALSMVMVYPLNGCSVDPCPACGGFGSADGVGRLAAADCPECGGAGYRAAGRTFGGGQP